MDILSLFAPRRHYGRSGGSTRVDLSDSLIGRHNRLERVRAQQTLDLETIYIEGNYTPHPGRIVPRLVTKSELRLLND
jgi:hypothetical protein